jgi:arylsulfatase
VHVGSIKLIAAHFGGTRNPMAVRWLAKIKPDAMPHPQCHHVNDMDPTISEIVGITPPQVVNGFPQDPFDGISFAYTFGDAKAKGRKLTQYFEIMGSRAIYHDGWMASAFGPCVLWIPGIPKGILEWTPDQDTWEIYNLEEDWSQANDLADKMPEKLGQLKEYFAMAYAMNKGLSVGGGLWVPVFHPELRVAPPYTE